MNEIRYGRKNPWRSFHNSILQTDLTTHEKLVYIVISSFATATDQRAFPSYKTIAEYASCSRTKAIAAVETLVKRGYLVKIKRKNEKGDPTSNLYIIFPADEPFDPSREWIDENGNIHEKSGSEPDIPPLVHDVNHPSSQDEPPLVHDVNPNKTNINKTKQQQRENVVVVGSQNETDTKKGQQQEDIAVVMNQFEKTLNAKITPKQAKKLIELAKKHEKDVLEAIKETKDYYAYSGQEPRNPFGAVCYSITDGWDLPEEQALAVAPATPAHVEVDDSFLDQLLEFDPLGSLEIETERVAK